MPSVNLTIEQIHKIRQDVQRAKVSFSHLEADLIDHICCYVEEFMEYGLSFEQAYARARKRINIEQLKDIEIKTILLINQKFKTMKTLMKITGIMGITLLLVSLIFKSGHIAGANVLFMLGVVSIAFAYIPALFLTVRREKLIKQSLPIFYSALVAVFLILISYIFSVMHWPLKPYVLLLSWISAFVFILILFLAALKNEENRIINLSVVLLLTIIVSLNIFSYSVSNSNPQNELRVLEYTIEESNDYFEKSLEALKKELKQKIDNELLIKEYTSLTSESKDVLNTLEQFQDQLFTDRAELRKYNKRFFKPYIKDETMQAMARKLEKSMQAYQLSVLGFSDRLELSEINQYIRKSIQFSEMDFNQNAIVLYNNISRLQRDIRIIEREILLEIMRQSVN